MINSIFTYINSNPALLELILSNGKNKSINLDTIEDENFKSIGDNISIFVNGYRQNSNLIKTGEELSNSKNRIFINDLFEYWDGIDKLFINNLKSQNNYYADGHFSVKTSNHKSIENFIKSLLSSLSVAGQIAHPGIDIIKVFHKEQYVQLNTLSNKEGFLFRIEEGKKAGEELIKKLIHFKSNQIKINIICHSMGFAYSLGIIEILKLYKFINLNKFYIIAPENAKESNIEVSLFNEIWQYGSKDSGANRDKLWEQDGMAPQTSVFKENNISEKKYGRIYIPNNVIEKGFINSHIIKNYNWIFETIKNGENGFVY